MRKRDLVGRRIVDVRFNRFPAWDAGMARKGEYANDPVLVLDNGQELRFNVQETDVGEYGIQLCLSKKPQGAR